MRHLIRPLWREGRIISLSSKQSRTFRTRKLQVADLNQEFSLYLSVKLMNLCCITLMFIAPPCVSYALKRDFDIRPSVARALQALSDPY